VDDDDAGPLTYGGYLALDELLGLQRPRTAEPDELLFIVIHQVYELWFKQLLHEGGRLGEQLTGDRVTDAMRTLGRMLAVLKTIVGQVDVLETMTPSQFTAFRGGLDASSGFESVQFRELEVLLGRRDRRVLGPHPAGTPGHARLTAAMARPSLLDRLLVLLAGHGYPIAPEVLARDPVTPYAPNAEVRAALLAVHRDDGLDAQLCERFVDLDEGVMEWRYRHVQMVRRMIGDRPGTGGSAGVGYLASTLLQPAFADLWAVRSEL
jgi:tryptophan 2,3-dioxygenase